ncbi:MAG TPA: alpha/beta hydrolase-fold protein [Gemmatimonadales bacterium]|nr:alpha/beta hydrolase-fold protein [Gemmatimonadales bacterium]
MISARRAVTSGFLLAAARAGYAQTPPVRDPVPVHDTFSIVSRVLAERRLINVHVPAGYAAGTTLRFPVLYMPDGGVDEDFPHVVNTVDSLIARHAIRSVIVVGIPNTERRRDLTGPTRLHSDSAIAPHVGGSANFRAFIRGELMPAIAARYRVTGERAIVGESLAGLFVLETFLKEPALFDHYVALDPSVWWNGGALVDSAPTLLAGRDSTRRTLFLASSSQPEIAAGTQHLATLLAAIPPDELTWVCTPRPDLTHATIYRAAGPGALAFALK